MRGAAPVGISPRASRLTAAIPAMVLTAAFAAGDVDRERATQWSEYEAQNPKTIVELQPFRRTTASTFEVRGRRGVLTLIEINPEINAWYLVSVSWPDGAAARWYHLENPEPKLRHVSLAQGIAGLRIITGERNELCELWRGQDVGAVEEARATGLPYAPLCSEQLYLRNPVAGRYTRLERMTNFLRDHVWGGEQIIGFVREQFYRDAFIERGAENAAASQAHNLADAPSPASLDPAQAERAIKPEHLDLALENDSEELVLGRWYGVRGVPGIFVSAIEPRAIDAKILARDRSTVAMLDSVEGAAIDYVVALDLARFDLGFALGTDHPRVGWSARVREEARNPALPGPDGIDSAAPLVTNGMVNPALLPRVAVTFTGGFKRDHGAFRTGPLAFENAGSHYGFMEQGAIFSKLQPGLATVYVTATEGVQMKTWSRGDDALLGRIVAARQNGVPLIQYDGATGASAAGALVNNWGAGNWSGSSDEKLRTLRAGVCLQESNGSRFLLYGYFSTATPSAMTRVFQAYGCRYAMHLDMNALEHTYFALYTRLGERMVVQHLIRGMEEVDRKGGEQLAPRFLSFPDDRDFFYALRKEHAP